MIAALFADCKSSEKSSALSAELSYKGAGVTITIPVNSSIYHQSHFNINVKSKINYLCWLDSLTMAGNILLQF